MLIELGLDPAKDENESIRLASKDGFVNTVRALLADPRIDPSSRGNYALTCASEDGYADIVGLLLADDRVHPDTDEQSDILQRAIMNNHYDVVYVLLNSDKIDPSEAGDIVELAEEYSSPDLVELVSQYQ